MAVSQNQGLALGALIRGIIVYWGLIGGPLFFETPIYHILTTYYIPYTRILMVVRGPFRSSSAVNAEGPGPRSRGSQTLEGRYSRPSGTGCAGSKGLQRGPSSDHFGTIWGPFWEHFGKFWLIKT